MRATKTTNNETLALELKHDTRRKEKEEKVCTFIITGGGELVVPPLAITKQHNNTKRINYEHQH